MEILKGLESHEVNSDFSCLQSIMWRGLSVKPLSTSVLYFSSSSPSCTKKYLPPMGHVTGAGGNTVGS